MFQVKPLDNSIQVENLTLKYISQVRRTRQTHAIQQAFGISPENINNIVVQNLSLNIRPGEIILITGPSGSGKTTLLNALAQRNLNKGLKQEGHIAYPENVAVGAFEPFHSEKALIEIFSAKKNIGSVRDALYLMGSVGLSDAFVFLKRFSELSTGQQYRAMLASLIARCANIWFIDEFCANLDTVTANVIADRLQKMARRLSATLVVAAPHCELFFYALQPDKVVLLTNAWEHKVESGAFFMSQLKPPDQWRNRVRQLHLKAKPFAASCQGDKTLIIRKNCLSINPGPLLLTCGNNRLLVNVVSVEHLTLAELTEHHAQRDGFSTLDALHNFLHDAYPSLTRNQEADVNDRIEPEQTAPNENAIDNIAIEENDRSELERQQEAENRRVEEESPEVTESATGRQRSRRATDSLYIRFRKIPCKASGSVILQRDGVSGWSVDRSALQDALDLETRRAQQVALDDPEHLRTNDSPDTQIRIPDESLAGEDAYKDFLATLNYEVVPEWAWQVEDVRIVGGGERDTLIPIFEFVNASPSPGHRNNEPFLFDTEANFKVEGAEVRPFEVELAPQGFRYDRTMWGRGFNCAIKQDTGSVDQLLTTHTPIYEQQRYETRSEPEAPFDALATDPIPVLTNILSAMESYRAEWDQARNDYIRQDPNWETEHGEEFNRDLATFVREIELFRRGIDLIHQDSDVLLSFQLTNETFRRLGNHPTKPKTSWRLFQIVFIVSQIPGVVALRDPNSPDAAEREQVDIIYFPTGGGKTEAYLGTIVFHCFFDRLRGKTAGVTAWTRFPLRLLTLQQTQRMADAIGVAEIVRREQTGSRLIGEHVDPFAVGYFVGSEATPNEVLNPQDYTYAQPKDNVIWSQANDSDERQRWKRVVRCPACRTDTVWVDFDSDLVRVIHRCTNEQCAFPNGEIPIYVIDNEIYRYLPTVIVGTIDKLAGIGNQRKFSQILGLVTGRCTRHGYYVKQCCQRGCEWKGDRRRALGLDQPPPQGLTGPTLFVQDELHLLKEGLGTFDGHYETFTQRLRAELGQDSTLKLIASSATIEAFERQVEHLYGRNSAFARRFPGQGPTLRDSFYAQTRKYPQRLFVGILPHNKTIFNTMLELIELYHRELQQLQRLSFGTPNPYRGTYLPGTQTWTDLLDNYVTSLTYFLATRELDGIHTDLEGDTNGRLRQDRLNPLDIHELTGGTSTADVTRILERIERTANPKDADAVLATSMVSHGVDIDRFNAMIFYGMPRQTAEYIQASSRVGRAHVGLVFTCMHPARERDHSHYAYFNKYHEYLGQLVEPVAVNRWATYSIDRTLPGLFMGVLLQLLAHRQDDVSSGRFYRRDYVVREINAGRITQDDFIPLLEDAYFSYVGDGIELDAYRDRIKHQIESFLYDQIVPSQASWVSEAFEPNKPMRSLRDVDEAVQIEIDQDGADWTERMSRTTW